MKKIIVGAILLLLFFTPLFVSNIMVYGIMQTLAIWGVAILLAIMLVGGIILIVNGLVDIGKL